MGYRLSKIVTRTGDDGTTGLGNGERVPKTSLRIDAIGDVDELNATIGLALTKLSPIQYGQPLLRLTQDRLFDLGGELSMPGTTIIQQDDVELLESNTECLNEMLEPLKNFIIPGGTQAAARLHFSRTVCRRAERTLWKLDESGWVNPFSLKYLNRLSDYLFVMARHASSGQPVLWSPKPKEDGAP